MVTLTKELPGQLDTRLTESEYRLTERVPLYFIYLNDRSIPLAWREPVYGLQTVELRGRWAR
jgi:hypothetical protein